MATTNIYRVQYHFENPLPSGGSSGVGGGKTVNHPAMDYVQAADSSYNTIKGVIVTNQGKGHGSSTFVIDSVINVGPTNILQ